MSTENKEPVAAVAATVAPKNKSAKPVKHAKSDKPVKANKTEVKPATPPVPEVAEPDPVPAPVPVPFSLDRLVSDAVKVAAPKVRENVVSTLVDKELARRTDAVMDAIKEIEVVKLEIRQIKPDQELFDDEGKPKKFFSKETQQKLQQKRERLEKLEKGIEAALRESNPDFGPILGAIKQK